MGLFASASGDFGKGRRCYRDMQGKGKTLLGMSRTNGHDFPESRPCCQAGRLNAFYNFRGDMVRFLKLYYKPEIFISHPFATAKEFRT